MKNKFLLFLFIIIICKALDCNAQCAVTINPPTTFVCEGSCITLTAVATGTAPFTYQWQPGGPATDTFTVCPTQISTYTVTALDGNGCSSSDTKLLIIRVPPVITISPLPFVCSGACVQLNATPWYQSYSWIPTTCLDSPLTAHPLFCCTAPGIYTYTTIITDYNGCTNSTTIPVTVDPCNSVNNIFANDLITIYPNPLTSSFTLQLNPQLKDAEVVIYDMLGKEMMRKKLTGDRMEIERGSLVSGVYFVRVRSEERQWVEKVVVE